MAGGELALNVAAKEDAERLRIEAAQRDRSRFAELYEDNFERVYAFIARRVHDRDEAEDLTSEVFHQALANLTRFEWRGGPLPAPPPPLPPHPPLARAKPPAKASDPPPPPHPPRGGPPRLERAAPALALL